MRNNSAECVIGNTDGVFRAREIRRLERQSRWDKEAVNNVMGVPWGMAETADGQWTDQIFERIRFQFLHCLLKEHEFRGKGSPSKTKTNSEPLLDAQVAM